MKKYSMSVREDKWEDRSVISVQLARKCDTGEEGKVEDDLQEEEVKHELPPTNYMYNFYLLFIFSKLTYTCIIFLNNIFNSTTPPLCKNKQRLVHHILNTTHTHMRVCTKN